MEQTSPITVDPPHLTSPTARLRHFSHRAIFFIISFQGLYGLYMASHDIFIAYPKIALYYQSLNFDQHAYQQLLQQAVLVSVSSFAETAIGLSMLVKKTHTIKNIHIALGIAISLLSLYLKRNGSIIDAEHLEELALRFIFNS